MFKSLDLRRYLTAFRYSGRALGLVWQTSRTLTLVLAALTVAAGSLPAGVAWVGKLIVDAVVLAARSGEVADRWLVLEYVGLEALLVVAQAAIGRATGVCQSILRAQLGHRVNVMILEKTLTLTLSHFEDASFYDKLTRARREASSRPLALVNRTFSLLQNALSLLGYGGLLFHFSPLTVLVLVLAALPAFVVETKFSGQAFRLFQWRVPETRIQMYLETLIAREDFAKEVQLFELGKRMLGRYVEIFEQLYREDRDLTLKRGLWGLLLGLVSTAALYGAYGWIAWEAALATITLGEMTMYLMVFRQSQAGFTSILSSIGGMYEDNLYLSNLYEFLEEDIPTSGGTAITGPLPGDGVHFEGVSFSYPGSTTPSLNKVSLHLRPGQKLALVGENGSGKTTLIKLLTRLYEPTEGRILLDGRDLREWDIHVLRRRIGVIFQDFVRYQLSVGENIGVGDEGHYEDAARWKQAAVRGLSAPFIDELPDGYKTQLGKWFDNGRELSGGQWQKIALSRAFMREGADVLVLDEPTSAMDAEAEVKIFEHFREVTRDQMAILISHRFSTVRMADHIVVLDRGQVVEQGSHEELMARNGRYAHLFTLQAAGYR